MATKETDSESSSGEEETAGTISTLTDTDACQERQHRNNTMEEKRRMRNARKRRLRQHGRSQPAIKKLKTQLEVAQKKVEVGEHRIQTLRCMTRTFWERWRWELEKRKETMIMNTRVGIHLPAHRKTYLNIHEIDVAMLEDPIFNGQQEEHYLGRGSFGVVKLQLYRGVQVAVKEFFSRTVRDDVKKEAEVLAGLCHPYLPYLFGICTASKPLRIVMQFHGFVDGTECRSSLPQSLTLSRELQQRELQLTPDDWLIICAQLLDAVDYLHDTADILHNDIKENNIVLGRSASQTNSKYVTSGNYQVVLIDFGKAMKTSQGKLYQLTDREKYDYRRSFPHLAPEVIDGEYRQSTYSDMYAVGAILYHIVETNSLSHTPSRKKLLNLAEMCRLVQYHKRVSAHKALLFLQEVVEQ